VWGVKIGVLPAKIALRLQAGQPSILQVDVADDGSADFQFERADVARIGVRRPPTAGGKKRKAPKTARLTSESGRS
jgi:hypothetical protein